jgi:hypothetical protein
MCRFVMFTSLQAYTRATANACGPSNAIVTIREDRPVDTDRIRELFVKTSINRACQDTEGHLAARTAREFRRYLDWHPDALPEPERSVVAATFRT